jgi:serine/threonine protein kinase
MIESLDEKYELLEIIGKGSDGIVRRAKVLQDDSEIAIKIINSDVVSSEIGREITEYEFKAHKSFSHEHIIKLYDYYIAPGIGYCILELCGDSLDVYRRNKNRILGQSESIFILHQMCLAIDYMHKKGYKHLDIKSSNIVGCGSVWKLIDFGFTTKNRTTYFVSGTLIYSH